MLFAVLNTVSKVFFVERKVFPAHGASFCFHSSLHADGQEPLDQNDSCPLRCVTSYATIR
jgi:hypothetical protein